MAISKKTSKASAKPKPSRRRTKKSAPIEPVDVKSPDRPATGKVATHAEIIAAATKGPDLSLRIALWGVEYMRVLREHVYGAEANRYAWPCSSPPFRFEGLITADACAIVLIHEKPGPSVLMGNGKLRETDLRVGDFELLRANEVHLDIRKRFSLRDQDAVFVLPLYEAVGNADAVWAAMQRHDEGRFLSAQSLFNVERHRLHLGLKVSPLNAPRRPGEDSKEGEILAQLEAAGPKVFVCYGASTTAINRLRKLGWDIQSAKKARAKGEDVPDKEKGYRLRR